MNYKKKTLQLILFATLVRCVTASCIGLGNDEVYYRMYAEQLQWNYFDHPPMVGWLIRFSTANLFFDNEFFIRLGAIASAAATTWLFFLCGKKLNNEYTGFLASAIYTATIYGSIIAGTFILPDSPQMVCWAAALYLLIDFASANAITKVSKKKILLFGIITGVGMLCKVHTAFLWLGFLLYIIFYSRQWLTQPVIYLSGFITILFFYPVIYWNFKNNFITYLYHSSRVNVTAGGFDINSFLTFTAGQIFYCNPVIFLLLAIATVAAFKNKLTILAAQKRILLFCSLPLIITATIISLFKNVLPHWTGPAYSGLILLTACYLAKQKSIEKKLLPKPVFYSVTLITILITAGIILINFTSGTLGKKEKQFMGEGDFTLDMYGWRDLKINFEKIVAADILSGAMKKDATIISNKWFPASHIDYYVAMPLKKDLIAIGDTGDIHQYAWINKSRKQLQPGNDAYCIVPSNYFTDVKTIYAAYFSAVLPSDTIEQKRNGKVCRNFYIWRLKNYFAK